MLALSSAVPDTDCRAWCVCLQLSCLDLAIDLNSSSYKVGHDRGALVLLTLCTRQSTL